MASIAQRVGQAGSVVLGLFLTFGGNLQATIQTTPAASSFGMPIPSPEDFGLPEPNVNRQAGLDLWATYYYVYGTESRSEGYSLLTPKGHELGAKVSHRDWCYGALQGTIRVRKPDGDASVYNFAGRNSVQQVDCSAYFSLPEKVMEKIGRVRFGPAQGPFGDGVQGMILVPYRSIAVDQRVIPYGSVVYIPAARGVMVTLPDGRKVEHDGYFFAADTGSAIKNQHIDIFSGDSGKNPFENFVKSRADGKFKAYIVKNTSLVLQLSELHKPNS